MGSRSPGVERCTPELRLDGVRDREEGPGEWAQGLRLRVDMGSKVRPELSKGQGSESGVHGL